MLGFVKVATLFPEKHCFVKHLSTQNQREVRKVIVTNVPGFIVNPWSLADRTFETASRMEPSVAKEWIEMLVLSRKKNESIVINDNINIVVVEIRGDKVRLGVEAPKEIPVHRREVYEAIMRDRESAAGLSRATETP